MNKYLEQAVDDFEHSQGDVSNEYNQMLKEYAKIKSLLAIAEGLQELIARLDTIATDLENIEYDLNTKLGR